jgi:hypothetical protein
MDARRLVGPVSVMQDPPLVMVAVAGTELHSRGLELFPVAAADLRRLLLAASISSLI